MQSHCSSQEDGTGYSPTSPPHEDDFVEMAHRTIKEWEAEGVFGPQNSSILPSTENDPIWGCLGPSLRPKAYDYDPNDPYFDQPAPQTYIDRFYAPTGIYGSKSDWKNLVWTEQEREMPLYGCLQDIEGKTFYDNPIEVEEKKPVRGRGRARAGTASPNKRGAATSPNKRGAAASPNKRGAAASPTKRGATTSRAVKKEALESFSESPTPVASSSRSRSASPTKRKAASSPVSRATGRRSRNPVKARTTANPYPLFKESLLKVSHTASFSEASSSRI
ncbi:hypothetical protein K435DRAFT_922287 [Dendrothele bispora CBS 962.96]|uniref:Uncharacterized protein n=1 Tax=Dendrothele bispora (strain CBS 962.96) TaxID=1314807 RepID=A0A4V4HDC5_DENBC|nr:hypothetical protein K435DRAFT_922287 [Dendrothele bispora CBS 962.96]